MGRLYFSFLSMLKFFFSLGVHDFVVLPHHESLSFNARLPSPRYSVTVFVTRWDGVTNSEGLITNQDLLSVFASLVSCSTQTSATSSPSAFPYP